MRDFSAGAQLSSWAVSLSRVKANSLSLLRGSAGEATAFNHCVLLPNLLSFLVFLFSSHLFFCYLFIFLNYRGKFCYVDVFGNIRTPEVTWVNFQGLGVAFARALWKFLCIYCCLRITYMYMCFGQASPFLNFFLYSRPHYFNLPTSCA